MATDRPEDLVIRGRLSWPKFTMPEAIAFNKSSDYPKKDEDVRPSFQLLVNSVQLEKLTTYVKDVFLPWCAEQEKAGEKASALTAAQVKKLTKIIDEADWETDPVLGLINKVHEKTVDLAPEAEATVKVNGFKGQDLVQKAIVRSTDQLANPHDDIIIGERGLIMDIADTNLELYPGSFVIAQLNLYAFVSAGNPGISATTPAVIFAADGERFGGGAALDEDSIFLADDED